MISQEELIRMALRVGFDDAYFVDAAPFADWEKEGDRRHPETRGLEADPGNILPGAASVFILLTASPPFSAFPAGFLPYPAYYADSNRAYFRAKALAEELERMGLRALHSAHIPLRCAALRGCGWVGKNRLMYHERFGSFFHIQGILTDRLMRPRLSVSENGCLHCDRCIRACPTGALSEAGFLWEKCLRSKMQTAEGISAAAEDGVQTLIGCEICQRVCPQNAGIICRAPKRDEYEPFAIEKLQAGGKRNVAAASRVVGPNIARRLPLQSRLFFDCGENGMEEG